MPDQVFFHGTTAEAWAAIQAEGVLWGVHSYRYTYLTPDLAMAQKYGEVVLAVEYEPKGPPADNFGFDPPPGETCWQFSVFVPIPVDRCSVYEELIDV